MDKLVDVQGDSEAAPADGEMQPLAELQLALVGGGIGDVIWQ